MHILHITYSLSIGGIEKLILNLSQGLKSRGYKVSVCSLSKGMKLANDFQTNGINVFFVPKGEGFSPSSVFKITDLVKKNRIDVIHTHNVGAWIYGGLAAKLCGKKLVHTEHSNVRQDQKKLRWAERILATFSDTIICVSKTVNHFLVNNIGISPKKIKTIYNGINLKPFIEEEKNSTAIRDELGLEENDFVLGIIARLVPIKDHKTLLSAMPMIKKQIPSAKLLVIGDGLLLCVLQNMTKDMHLGDDVLFLGERDDVPDLIKALDLFVLSSKSEGMPLSILEAMASGLPVVATKVGGIPEIICDGEGGILVPPSDAAAMAEAVVSLAKKSDALKTMGENNRQQALEQFDIEKMTERYIVVYSKVLGKAK